MGRIYFDNAASTPLDPRVAEAMTRFAAECYGNPSSLHAEGRAARLAVEEARASVARLINAASDEIIFTGSGTEADNLALAGIPADPGGKPGDVVAGAIEHPAVLEKCRHLERLGAEVVFVRPDADGIIQPETLAAALRPETSLVSLMAANNVTGVLQPVAELAAVARRRRVLFHTDAVQAMGRIPIDVRSWDVDLLSLSAHKIYGPKGVGALYIRRGVRLAPCLYGGGQERGLRSSTENAAGIVGFGRAADIAAAEGATDAARLVRLRETLLAGVLEAVPNAYLIGHREKRLPGHLCLGFAGQEGEAIKLLLALDDAGVAVSSGSACNSSHAGEPSGVLAAMGFDALRSRGSVRISLGRFNSEDEVRSFVEILPRVCGSLRPLVSRRASSPDLKGA